MTTASYLPICCGLLAVWTAIGLAWLVISYIEFKRHARGKP